MLQSSRVGSENGFQGKPHGTIRKTEEQSRNDVLGNLHVHLLDTGLSNQRSRVSNREADAAKQERSKAKKERREAREARGKIQNAIEESRKERESLRILDFS